MGPQGPQDRLHHRKSTVKNKFTRLRVQKIDSTKMRAPTKRETTVKNKFASESKPPNPLKMRAPTIRETKPVPRGQQNRLHQKESTVKNKYASRSPSTTSSNESTHQKGNHDHDSRGTWKCLEV